MTHTITDDQLKKLRDNIEYLVDWQSKDGAAVVVEVATESLSILNAIEKQPESVDEKHNPNYKFVFVDDLIRLVNEAGEVWEGEEQMECLSTEQEEQIEIAIRTYFHSAEADRLRKQKKLMHHDGCICVSCEYSLTYASQQAEAELIEGMHKK